MRLGLNFGPLMLTGEHKTLPGEVDFGGLHIGNELMFGGTPAPGLVIGGYIMGNTTRDPSFESGSIEGERDGTLIFAGIGAFANYYFDPQQGFHLQALLGFAAIDIVSDDGASGGNDPSGFMLGIGAGYDFWIGGEWSIGPFARIIYAPTGVDDYTYTYLYPSIGVAFTYH